MRFLLPVTDCLPASPSAKARRGYTLLEMVAVISILAILSLAAVASFRPETFGDVSAKVDARRVALDLLQARRRSIASGDNHLLVFRSDGGSLVGYTLNRRLPDSSTLAVDAEHLFSTNLTVTITPSSPEFTFEGSALASYVITLTAPHRTWQVSVVQATGSVSVVEL